MSSRTIRWWWLVLAATGLAIATTALVWSLDRLLVGAGSLLAVGSGLMHVRAARRRTQRTLSGLERLIRKSRERSATHQHANELLETKVVELEERTRVITLLGEMSDHLQAAVDPAEVHAAIGSYAQRLFPLDAGALYTVDPAQHLVEVVAGWGKSSPRTAFASGDCRALRTGRVQVIGGDEAGDICAHVAHHSAAVHACIPIPVLGESHAMVYLRWYPGTAKAGQAGRTLGPFHTKAIAAFAKQVGLALTNLRLKERLRTQAMHDPLTGLYNRRFLEDAFHRELLRAARNQIPVSVLMLDLDHFKIFNDEHGHAAGDALLQAVAVGLRGAIRAEDIACRFGGEEFVVVMADTSLEDARMRADQVRKSVREVFVEVQGRRLGGITISAGIAVSPDHGDAPEALLQAADLALYAAKAGGRDRTRLAAQIVGSARVGPSSSAQARDKTLSG